MASKVGKRKRERERWGRTNIGRVQTEKGNEMMVGGKEEKREENFIFRNLSILRQPLQWGTVFEKL